MKHKLEFFITMIFLKLLMLFPESARFKFAEFLGWVGYKLIKKRRLIALANLKLAFPEKTDKQREAIALNSYKVMTKAFLSSMWFEKYLKEEGKVKLVGMDAVKKLYSQDKGVMVALMHMGNMEASLKAGEYYHITTVAKSQRNPYLDHYITKKREEANVTLLKKSRTTSRELMERIQSKDVIALFSDHRDKGAVVDFFGEETVAPTGAVSLALKYDMPFVLAYNVMHSDNTCTTKIIEVKLDITGNFKNDVLTNTQKVIDVMERIIEENPSQWMWFHDRWKLYKKLYKK